MKRPDFDLAERLRGEAATWRITVVKLAEKAETIADPVERARLIGAASGFDLAATQLEKIVRPRVAN